MSKTFLDSRHAETATNKLLLASPLLPIGLFFGFLKQRFRRVTRSRLYWWHMMNHNHAVHLLSRNDIRKDALADYMRAHFKAATDIEFGGWRKFKRANRKFFANHGYVT